MCSKSFANEKHQKLASVDNSRKGSIDEYVVNLVNCINSQPEYYTTSSCSGRIVIFQQPEDCIHVKKDCQWLLVSHHDVNVKDIIESLENHEHSAVLKFEPLIIHISCASLEAAKHMHCISVASGFRNSGITIGNKGKIMVAVRSTLGLEIPLSLEGELLISEQYLEYIVKKANEKMRENKQRIDRFFSNLQSKLKPEESHSKETIKDYKLDGITEHNEC